MRFGGWFNLLRCGAILLIVGLGVPLAGLVAAAGETIVSVSPSSQTVDAGGTFTIDIAVEPGEAIAGVQFDLGFDPSLVTVSGVEEGNLLSQGGASTYFISGDIDNGAGTVTGVAGAIISPGQTVSTAGTFAVITLVAGTVDGTSSLELSNVVAGDINGNSVPIISAGGDVTITGGTTPPPEGGGGGGGIGPTEDITPPRIHDVLARDITKTGADICWETNEWSTSQVEYRASPSQLSPLDETAVIAHTVRLSGLAPATTYFFRVMSQDEAGNRAVSDEYSFTTLGEPAAFTVSALNIDPADVYVGEAVPIFVLVTNNGDVAGDYEVVLKIDGVVVATKNVTGLASGASQEVTFNAARDSAGVFTVDVNGVTASFIVRTVPTAELALASLTPRYDAETQQLTFARVIYQVDNLNEPMSDVELILKVSLDGEPLEELSLLSASRLDLGGAGGILDYSPPQGWQSGIYTFEAELYTGGRLHTTTVKELEVTVNPDAAVVSWAVLGGIIGVTMIAIAGTMLVVLRRRRSMLRA